MGFFSGITGASLLNAGAGIVTSLLGNSSRRQRRQAELQDEFNARNQQRQYDYQTKLNQQAQDYNLQNMEIQNQYAMENWLAQQEYNSPENQLKRVKDAGLNPNMVMGQGQITNATNSVPDTPDSSSPSGGSAGSFQTDVPYVDSPLKAAFNSAQQALQTSLQYQTSQADQKQKLAYARLLAEQNAKQIIENKMLSQKLKMNQDFLDKDYEKLMKSIDAIDQEILESKAREGVAKNNADLVAAQNYYYNELSGKVVQESLEAEANARYAKWKADYVDKYNTEPPRNIATKVWNNILEGLDIEGVIDNVKHPKEPFLK